MTDQNNPDGSQGTTQGNDEGSKKPADKPVQPNEDVEGTNGPINT